MAVRIGTSGWSYDHWDDVLYRPGLPVARRLARYVEVFDTVELNASFYRWPKDTTFAGWRERLPEGFTMAVKVHRGLSHFRRLATPEEWIDRIRRCWDALGDKHEAMLIQLHPQMSRDDGRLDAFLRQVPRDIRVALELRHPSWDAEPVYALLEEYGAAYVVMSGANLPCVLRATSDLVYVRLHGPHGENLYDGSYSEHDLRWWADRIGQWREQNRRVVVYFNNDLGGHAVRNATRLRELVT